MGKWGLCLMFYLNGQFYFILKSLFVLKICKCLSPYFFGNVGKCLDKKARVSLKIYEVQIGKQTITMHVLRNISRSKDNKTMKFGQLIEHNLRNTFLQKSCIE